VDGVAKLAACIRLATTDVEAAMEALKLIENQRIREWCVEHGQMSGIARHRMLGRPAAHVSTVASALRDPSPTLATQVLQRDGYHCRYCGLAVIPRDVLVAFGKLVGGHSFPTGRRNEDRHGAALAAWAQVDHVVPYRLGGATMPENLVTACWACNYGKDRFTLEQLGLSDPRERPPVATPWDGLSFLVATLRDLRRTRVA
jgi:hypothetical protein